MNAFLSRAASLLGLAVLVLAVLTAPLKAADREVVFLRGIFGVFSSGLDDMSKILNNAGISSKVYIHGDWRDAGNYLVEQRKKGGARRIVIVGHSLGANAALQLSRFLGGKRMRVDHLITLDPTLRRTVSRNVRRATNFYLPQSVWGEDLAAAKGFSGTLTNIKLATTRDFGHFNMENDDQLQRLILSTVDSALRGRRPRTKKHRFTIN